LGCLKYGEDGKPEEIKVATTNVRWLSAGGSTFIAPIIDRWDNDYGKSHPLHINYLPVGSGGGIDRLRKGYGDFIATDAPLTDDQLQELPPVVQFPVIAGPVCVICNLPGLKTPLRLSGRTLAASMQARSTIGRTPQLPETIQAPHFLMHPLLLCIASDGSGTTQIFTNYLSAVSATWKTKAGQGLTVNWPKGIGANGSNAVLSAVKGSVGAIGYGELAYAKAAGMPAASIQNRAGDFIAPSPVSAFLAVNASIDLLAKDLRTPIIDPPATAKGAYPITGLFFILIPKDNKGLPGDQAALRDYIAYALSRGTGSGRGAFVCQTSASGSTARAGAPGATDPKRPAYQLNLAGNRRAGLHARAHPDRYRSLYRDGSSLE
jgi:phosphate transport system substrate-binding protein